VTERVHALEGVYLLDTVHMGLAGTIGSYLLPTSAGGFALIETGPGSTLAALEQAIREAGFEPEALEDVLITHIHLDHAGAAGALARRYGATVWVHERGAPHLADPSRLVRSAARIYGDEMETLWGEVASVPAAQLRALKDGEAVKGKGVRAIALDTPGHASHHLCYWLDDGILFTGDAAAIKMSGAPTIRPALPPPELDLEAWEASLERMKALAPSRLLLTHFGEVREAREHLDAVAEKNRKWAEVILEGMRLGESDEALIQRITEVGLAELEADGATPEAIAKHRVTSSFEMTVWGVKRYWQTRHPERIGPA
jgi:glyoxylase-like metal-dependent hydrolase (beta-lactamase superfamily II)